MHPIIALLDTVISLYSYAVFAYVIIQLLSYFRILNTSQSFVVNITRFLSGIIEPALQKIRKYVKPYNGFDISPMILLLGLNFIQYCLHYYF